MNVTLEGSTFFIFSQRTNITCITPLSLGPYFLADEVRGRLNLCIAATTTLRRFLLD